VISIDSSPSAGNRSLVDFLSTLGKEKNLFPQIYAETHKGIEQANLILRPSADRPPMEFLLQSHLDTAEPGPFGLWKHNGMNPYEAHIFEGKIYGLGAASSKLDFLCKLEALASFEKKSFRLPPVLVGTFGEETGMTGALKAIRKNIFNARMGLIGDPTQLKLATAGKGLAVVQMRIPFSEQELAYRNSHNMEESTSSQSRVFSGKPAHSSAPGAGDSALKKLFESLALIPEGIVIMEIDGGISFNTVPANGFLEIDVVSGITDPMARKLNLIYKELKNLEEQFLEYPDADFNPPHPTLNIGMIRTYESHVEILGCCRIPPTVPNDVYEAWMKKLTTVCAQVESEFRLQDYKRPYSTSENSVLVKVCQDELSKMGLSNITTTQSSTNESSLWNRIGIECVSFGPGRREENINTPGEHVSIDELEKSIDFYKRMITRFCL
jgi:acetylornithine deacetylase/succinyl-diaminopimelate desuccinylase-like protein